MSIEVTPRKVFGYILIAIGVVLFFFVIIGCLLLVTGATQPIRINTGYLEIFDVVTGLALQLGIYSLLGAVGFSISKIGVSLCTDKTA